MSNKIMSSYMSTILILYKIDQVESLTQRLETLKPASRVCEHTKVKTLNILEAITGFPGWNKW